MEARPTSSTRGHARVETHDYPRKNGDAPVDTHEYPPHMPFTRGHARILTRWVHDNTHTADQFLTVASLRGGALFSSSELLKGILLLRP